MVSAASEEALAPSPAEVRDKLARLREAMARAGAAGVLLGTRRNFAWLTDGAASHVSRADPSGVGRLLVTPERAYLLADNIETPRFLAEEVDPAVFEPVQWPWWKSAPDGLLRLVGGALASDVPGDGRPEAEPWIAPLRFVLTERERARARWIGARVARAAGDAARGIRPGATEREVEGALSARLLADGVFPAVILVGGDDRMARFRHPIPTAAAVEQGAMVVVTAERWGLHLSCTRTAWLRSPGEAWLNRFGSCRRVEAAMIRAARPGATLGAVLRAGQDAYAREGFPKEWELHHQGGLAGYAPREVFAKPGDFTQIAAGQLHAWNPTIQGTKSEDSFLVADDGPEVVTVDPTWPSETVSGPGGPLERPAAVLL